MLLNGRCLSLAHAHQGILSTEGALLSPPNPELEP